MPLSYAQELQKKKEEEERQKAEQKVVGQQQKTQPEASKPTGSTSIPTSQTREQSQSESRQRDQKLESKTSERQARVNYYRQQQSNAPKRDTQNAKVQSRNERREKTVNRDVTHREAYTDTNSNNRDLRSAEQKAADRKIDNIVPNYSKSMGAANSQYRSSGRRDRVPGSSINQLDLSDYLIKQNQPAQQSYSQQPFAPSSFSTDRQNINFQPEIKANNNNINFQPEIDYLPGPNDLPSVEDESRQILPYAHYEKPKYRNGVKWDKEDGTKGTLTISGKDFLGTGNSKLTKEDIQRGVDSLTPEEALQWMSPEYKLDKDARKIAKHYAQQNLSQYRDSPNGMPVLNTPEEREDYANLLNLANKTSPLASFAQGLIDPFMKVGRLARDIVAEPFASEETKDWNRRADELWNNANLNAKMQNPTLNAAGELAGNAAEYALTEPLVGATAAAIGVKSALGKFVVNQAVNLAQDGVLDIAPMINDLSKRTDLTEDQKIAQIAGAIGMDAGGNLLGAGASQLISNIGKGAANSVPDIAEQIAKNTPTVNPRNVAAEFNSLPQNDVVEGISKQIYNEGVNPDLARGFNYGEDIGNQQRTIWNGSGRNIEGYRQPDIQKPGGENAFSGKNGQSDSRILRKSSVNNTDGAIRKQMDAANISDVGMKYSTDIQKYSEALDAARKSNGHGVFVSGKSPEELQEIIDNGGKMLIDDYGRAGVVIAPNGDIEGVFHNGKLAEQLGLPKKKALSDLMVTAIANGGDRLDCYGEDLARMYMRYGFEPVAVSEYVPNKPWSVEMDAWKADEIRKLAGTEGTPTNTDVYILKLRDGWTVDDAIEAASKGTLNDYAENADLSMANINKNVPDEIKQLPLEDQYDSMIKYRDSLLDMDLQFFADKQPEKAAFFDALNTSKVPDADSLKNASAPENFLDEFAKTHPEDVAEDTAKAANNATTNDTAISQARTNVFERSGINAEESKNIYKAEDYSYVKDSNPAQMERAAENLNKLGDDAVAHYTSKDFDPKKASVEDVDSMMMLTERLRNEARATSDAVEKSKLYAQSRDLSIKSVQAASEFGRDLQSWSKWADTPERVVDKGYGVLLNKTDDFLKSNPRVKWGIEDVSDGIEKLFKEKDVAKVMESGDAEAIAKLKREISNGIDNLIKNADKGTQKALKGLSEKEIDQLMYENSTKSISQALEMFAGTGSMGLKDSTVDEIFDLMAKNESLNPNSKAFVQNEKKIYSMIANDLTKGGTFGQKVDTWRYLSMLTNPSTHLRNLTGNITMQGVAGVKNDLAAIIESAADRVSKSGIDRTKGIVNPFTDSDLLAATKKDAIDNAYRQLSGNRYTGISQGIESEVKAFKDKGVGKAINKISDVNSGALSAEDEFFKVNEYSTALAGYLKGNGFDASILGDELSEENAKQLKKIFGKGQRARAGIDSVEGMKDQFLQDARAYAVNKANVQTFNNSNEIANKFSNFSRGLRESDNKGAKALGYALDVTIPFKNVPANVLNTAIAYSPAEWAKVLAETNKLKKGSMNAADFIDEVATATTGTVGMALGAYLAHEGIVRMGSEKGTREKNFDKATDKLNGAISINGKSVDMTQLMPSAAPLIYGAMVYDVMANKDNGLSALDTITSGLAAVADGVTDMTMLSGLSDILEAGKYADDKNSIWGTIGAKVASNAVGQMVPTVGGRIEKVLDDTQRNSWYSDKAGLAKDVETAAKYNSSKIPGAQFLGEKLKDSDNKALSTIGDLTGLEPRINSKGEEMKNKGGNALGRAVNAVLPLELGSDRSTETDNKLRELAYKFPAGDERDAIFPYAKQSEAKFNNADGEQVQLTSKQWTEYQKSKGQMTNEMIDKFLNSDSYEQMEDVDRAETLKKMYDFATKYNQHVIGNGKLSKDMQELADIYESDGVDGILSQMMGKAIAESAGVRGNSNAAKAIQEDIANGNMDAANEKAEAYGSLSDYGLTNKSAINVYNYAAENNSDVNIEEFAETYKKLDSNENGSITQKELLEYANSGDHTQEEIDQLWDTYLAGSYTKVPVLEDGEWKSKKPSSETTNTPKTETTTKPTNTTQTQKGNATAKPKSGLSKRQQVAQQHSWTNNQSAKTENSIPDATDLPDASTDIAPKSTVRSYVDQNGNTQTYDMATTKWYQNGISAGYSSDDVIRMHDEANYDGQGKVTKDEAKQYINSNYANASAEEKRRLFSFICTSKAKNPY